MTREDIFKQCTQQISKTNCLLLELPTGYGKSKLSIDLVNNLCDTVYKGKKVKMLLLVAKTVHKITWKDEFKKWGGINVDKVTIECYESLRKHIDEYFDIVVLDECHHIGSETRMELLRSIPHKYTIGLSATIPFKIKQFFKFRYHSQVVSCDITEAIEDEVLPEPQILLYPLELDNTEATETIEVNPKSKGPVRYGTYNDLWKYKKSREHAFLSCTKRQKLIDMNSRIDWERNQAMRTRSEALKTIWLHDCGVRLEYLANCRNQVSHDILKHLQRYRTITFCKTIEQCEILGKNCIHSKNSQATDVYDRFNEKKINHITTVNILNENANLVDCKYALFANLSSSEVLMPQRIGRSLRHKSPVIIVPYYRGTREQEIVEKVFKDYNKDFIRIINSTNEI